MSHRDTSSRIDRRHFLRSSGAVVSLPLLEAMIPRNVVAAGTSASPKRLAVMTQDLGVIHDTFFPAGETSREYTMPDVLAVAEEIRSQMTVFSNIDHDLRGGHHAAGGVLNGVKPEFAASSPFGAISVDQRAAEIAGSACRYNSLRMWGSRHGLSRSYSRQGTQLPSSAGTPSEMYKALFLQGSETDKTKARALLREGKSILDLVSGDAKRLSGGLGKTDREKLDEYFQSVRSVELKLSDDDKWLDRPKPKCPDKKLDKIGDGNADGLGLKGSLSAWVDLTHLALVTDSTRVASIYVPINEGVWELPGVTTGAHTLSHHGKEEWKIEQFRTIGTHILSEYVRLVQKLAEDRQADGTSLMDSTAVLYASGLSNGSTHSNVNLPVILAGGSGEHGYHRNVGNKQPLNSLYLSLIQWFDPSVTEFNNATRPLTGLELG